MLKSFPHAHYAFLACALALQAAGFDAAAFRGDVEFLASDLLEGRDTPSAGLDTAAENIAASFAIAGLEPAVHGAYFQDAPLLLYKLPEDDFQLIIGGLDIPLNQAVVRVAAAADLKDVPLMRIERGKIRDLKPEQAAGKALLVMPPDLQAARALRPLATLVYDRSASRRSLVSRTLREPPSQIPHVIVSGQTAGELIDKLPVGDTGLHLTLRTAAPKLTSARARNILGLLPGSDPVLRQTYILLSAHYDHVGSGEPSLEGRLPGQDPSDRIWNGANDNASSVAMLLALARRFAAAPERPARSILFAAWFGEEKGFYGSEHYVKHPVVPLAQTLAMINLEHLGRTDDPSGNRQCAFLITGGEYSTAPSILQAAAEQLGVTAELGAKYNPLFLRSDNFPFARAGVPAHTLAVAAEFPDYHRPSDEADKLDYQNMAQLADVLYEGIRKSASAAEAPKWISRESSTRFIEAAKAAGHPSAP